MHFLFLIIYRHFYKISLCTNAGVLKLHHIPAKIFVKVIKHVFVEFGINLKRINQISFQKNYNHFNLEKLRKK